MDNLQNSTLGNILWKLFERVGAQLISFVVQLVLARLLMPDEFAVIAIVTVFISIFNVFITNGLGTALIQKKDADDLDFSTVLIFNTLFSGAIYGILFLIAPMVAAFYGRANLTPILRVLGIQILLSGFKTVQQAYVARKLIFRRFFWATLIGTITSGVVGVSMAYTGAGPWALVAQHLTNSAIDVLILMLTIGWKPKLQYSGERLKPLAKFGWKILASALVNNIYNNLRTLVIGKKYSGEDLAYFNRGQQIPDLIYDNTAVSIESVLFPVMSKVQDDIAHLCSMTRRFIKECSYIMIPMLAGVAVVAEPMVNVLLTEKWQPAIPYIQIYCIVRMFGPMQIANMQIPKALGRSDISLRVEIIKKVVGLLILLVSMHFGVIWIALSNLVYSVFVLIINAYYSKKLIGYGLWQQVSSVLPTAAVTLVMAVAVYAVRFTGLPDLWMLLSQIAVGATVYLAISVVFRMEEFTYLVNMLRKRLPSGKK